MTRIKAQCPGCGVVRLAAPDVLVRCEAQDGPSAYAFECPVCAHVVVHEVSPAVCAVLVSVGAREGLVLPVTAGPTEPVEAAPPFVPEDVDRFRELLDSDGWLDHLTAPQPPPA